MSNNIFLMNGETGKLLEFGKVNLPELKTENNVQWVVFGTDPEWYNQYPQYIDYLSKTSPKNGAILKAKTRYVYGRGWEVEKTGLSVSEIIEVQSFLAKANQGKVTKKNIGDHQKHGGFCAEMIPSKDGKVWTPKYLPFRFVRIAPTQYNEDKSEKPAVYWYTRDWSKKAKAKENKDFQEFHPFPWDKKEIDKSKRYIVYYKDDEYDNDTYPLPNYIQGIPYIDADAEVGNFVNHNVKNGFSAGLLVNFFNGDPDDDQKAEIQEMWDKAKHGTDNAGAAILAFNEQSDQGVKVEQIAPNGQDDRYVNLNNQIRDEIFTAHTVSPLVVGMKGDNGFSNNADEKRQSKEDFIEDYAIPQQEPHNEFMNAVLRFNEIKGIVKLSRIPMTKPKVELAKLFEVADRAEIRSIYREMGFDLKETKDEAEPVQQALKELNIKFLKEQDSEIIQAFSECGTEDEKYICFDSKPLHATDLFDARNQAGAFKHEFASKIESAILKIISAEPNITPKGIADLLNETPKVIEDIVSQLESNGLVENGQLTEAGKTELDENQIFVVYKYALRPDAEPLKGGESREFCQKMMELSQTRSWTLDDIQTISNRVGYDVFARRGGWYTLPDTNTHLPYCRHFWNQRLVRSK